MKCLFIFCAVCEQCNKKYLHGSCPVHGLPCFIKDKHINVNQRINQTQLRGPNNFAGWTTPDCLEVSSSNIAGAGLGVYTRQTILKGTMFGPYRGPNVYAEIIGHNSSYTWAVTMAIYC